MICGFFPFFHLALVFGMACNDALAAQVSPVALNSTGLRRGPSGTSWQACPSQVITACGDCLMSKGASAWISLNFTGSAIALRLVRHGGGPLVTVEVDGKRLLAETYLDSPFLDCTDPLIFSVANLTDGVHSLWIYTSRNGTGSQSGRHIILTSIQIIGDGSTIITSAGPSQSVSSTPAPTATSPNSTSNGENTRDNAIVGVAVALALALFILACLSWYIVQRNRPKRVTPDTTNRVDIDGDLQPEVRGGAGGQDPTTEPLHPTLKHISPYIVPPHMSTPPMRRSSSQPALATHSRNGSNAMWPPPTAPLYSSRPVTSSLTAGDVQVIAEVVMDVMARQNQPQTVWGPYNSRWSYRYIGARPPGGCSP